MFNSDFAGVLLSKKKEESLTEETKKLYEEVQAGTYGETPLRNCKLTEETIGDSDVSVNKVKETFGSGVSITFGDKEVRYISDVLTTDSLIKKLQAALKNGGVVKLIGVLQKYAIEYHNSSLERVDEDCSLYFKAGKFSKKPFETSNEETTVYPALEEEIQEVSILGTKYEVWSEEGATYARDSLTGFERKIKDEGSLTEESDIQEQIISSFNLDEGRVKESIISEGDSVKYDGKEYTVVDIEGRYYELKPEDKRRKNIFVVDGLEKINK